VVQNLVLLYSHQQNVHLGVQGFQNLVTEVHVGDVEGNVLAGFHLDAVVKLFLAHKRQRDALDDDGMAGDGGSHVFGLNLLAVEDVADGLGHRGGVHNGAVHHRVLRQGFQAVAGELVGALGLLAPNWIRYPIPPVPFVSSQTWLASLPRTSAAPVTARAEHLAVHPTI
jgi:hypothetical protein